MDVRCGAPACAKRAARLVYGPLAQVSVPAGLVGFGYMRVCHRTGCLRAARRQFVDPDVAGRAQESEVRDLLRSMAGEAGCTFVGPLAAQPAA
jgi:hypothetical protein